MKDFLLRDRQSSCFKGKKAHFSEQSHIFSITALCNSMTSSARLRSASTDVQSSPETASSPPAARLHDWKAYWSQRLMDTDTKRDHRSPAALTDAPSMTQSFCPWSRLQPPRHLRIPQNMPDKRRSSSQTVGLLVTNIFFVFLIFAAPCCQSLSVIVRKHVGGRRVNEK